MRAEAAAGFPGVREASLPRLRACLKAGLCLNDACLCALVALMARTQDTNALHRGGIRGAQAVQEKARSLDEEISGALAAGRIREEMPRLAQFLRAWNDELCQARISPGGCADLLALTLLMHFSQEADPEFAGKSKEGFHHQKTLLKEGPDSGNRSAEMHRAFTVHAFSFIFLQYMIKIRILIDMHCHFRFTMV